MKELFELRKNNRVQRLVEKGATPNTVPTPEIKKLLVDMDCAADVPVVQKKIDMLLVDIVTGGMMRQMMPGERFGLFEVVPGAESEFRTMAEQQGLTVLEVRG